MAARGEDGQATVELALCLPLAAILLSAALEVGLLGLDRVRIWHAAREAARTAAVTADVSEIRASVARAGVPDAELEVSPEVHGRTAGETVTVIVSEQREGSVPLIGLLFRTTIEGRATMRIESP